MANNDVEVKFGAQTAENRPAWLRIQASAAAQVVGAEGGARRGQMLALPEADRPRLGLASRP